VERNVTTVKEKSRETLKTEKGIVCSSNPARRNGKRWAFKSSLQNKDGVNAARGKELKKGGAWVALSRHAPAESYFTQKAQIEV